MQCNGGPTVLAGQLALTYTPEPRIRALGRISVESSSIQFLNLLAAVAHYPSAFARTIRIGTRRPFLLMPYGSRHVTVFRHNVRWRALRAVASALFIGHLVSVLRRG